MKLHLSLLLTLFLSVQSFISCNVIEEIIEPDNSTITADDFSITVKTTEETLLFANTVTLNGAITYEGTVPRGNITYFRYSKDVSKAKELLSSGITASAKYKSKTTSFYAKLTLLEPNTTYYYIACFEVSGQLAYTPVATFTTKNDPYDPASYEAVDLALSVKWANKNLGAVSPEDYGAFFSWGETTTKTSFSWSTYKYCEGASNKLTKYNTSELCGVVDNLTKLLPEDDAATVRLGKPWRMPTPQEIQELISKCTYEWHTINGVKGVLFISSRNGCKLFFPTDGYIVEENHNYPGSRGIYMTTDIDTSHPFRSQSFDLYETGIGIYAGIHKGDRYMGFVIRPVCDY